MKAGLPAARINFAEVKLNGRDLGLYVLVEPTDKAFLNRHFGAATGNLYEGSNTDVEDVLELDSGNSATDQRDLQALASACREPGLQRRWERLRQILDVDRFASFMAMEVLVCHHDGYSLDRNNFRIYHDPRTDRMVFIPHGMDLIFDQPELSLEPEWRGTVAHSFMETPEGRRMYRQQLAELAGRVYGSHDLENRLGALSRFLQDQAGPSRRALAKLESAIAELGQVLRARKQFVLAEATRLPRD